MATLVDRVRRLLHTRTRPLLSTLGFRTTRVIVRTRTWSEGKIQTGTPSVSDLEILPRPDVDALAGDPVVQVRRITPLYAASVPGGYTPAQLNPADAPGVEYVYILIGADGVERPYKLLKLDTTPAFEFKLELQAIDRKVPF